MRKELANVLFSLSILLLDTSTASAGAWVKRQGEFFFSLQPYYYETDQFFDGKGRLEARGGKFRKWAFNPYLEYGVTDKTTLAMNVSYTWLWDHSGKSSTANRGFADVEISCRRLLWVRAPHISSFQATAIVPTGYDIGDNPRLGFGRWGAQGALLYARHFRVFERYGFFDSQVGFRVYFGYPSEQCRAQISVGYDPLDRLQLIAAGELDYGLNTGSAKPAGDNVLIHPDYRLLKLTAAARLNLSQEYSLGVACYRHIWGENTGGGGGFYGSLWFHL